MKKKVVEWAAVALATAFAGGCANVPKLAIEGPVTVAQIIDQVQCEIAAAKRDHPRLNSPTEAWRAIMDLSLRVDDGAGLTPTVSFINPLPLGESFTFGASAALKGARTRIYAQRLEMQVRAITTPPCDLTPGIGLTGNLGIEETVRLGFGSLGPGDAGQFSGQKDAFGETIQFVLTMNLSGVGPTWKLVRFTGPGGLFGMDRTDTHKLIISFQPAVLTEISTVVEGPPGARVKRQVRTRVTRGVPSNAADQLNFKMLLESLPAGTLSR